MIKDSYNYAAYFTADKRRASQDDAYVLIDKETSRKITLKLIGRRFGEGLDKKITSDERRHKSFLISGCDVHAEINPDTREGLIVDVSLHHEKRAGLVEVIKFLNLPYVPEKIVH